jgi:integrin beta 3
MRDLQKFIDGLHDYIGKALRPLAEQIRGLAERVDALADREPEKGADGKDGVDGVSPDPDSFLPALKEWFEAAWGGLDPKALLLAEVAAIPAPRDGVDGKDGANGQDGKSITIEDVRDLLETAQAKWALEFEIRAQATLQRAIDAMPKPLDGRDGVDGKDGRDGLDLKNFSAEQDGRSVVLTLKDDERTEEVRLSFPVTIDAGFWKPGMKAEAGDGVTFGGSYWIAQKDTETQPEVGNPDWRLAVRKGRDARMVQTDANKAAGKPVRISDQTE